MKRYLILAVALATIATSAYAMCTMQSYTLPDGRYIVCTTCCDAYNNCNTTCI